MGAVKIADYLTVAGQPDMQTARAIVQEGFAAIVSTGPHGEEAGLPWTEAEAAAACQDRHAFNPVKGLVITEAGIRVFQNALSRAVDPIFTSCRGGTRGPLPQLLKSEKYP